MITEKSDLQRVLREIQILKKLRHPHIIQLYEVFFFFIYFPFLFLFINLFKDY